MHHAPCIMHHASCTSMGVEPICIFRDSSSGNVQQWTLWALTRSSMHSRLLFLSIRVKNLRSNIWKRVTRLRLRAIMHWRPSASPWCLTSCWYSIAHRNARLCSTSFCANLYWPGLWLGAARLAMVWATWSRETISNCRLGRLHFLLLHFLLPLVFHSQPLTRLITPDP